MFNEMLFDDDAYDLPPMNEDKKTEIIKELTKPVERTEYAINYRDETDNNARQVTTAIGTPLDVEKELTNQIKEGVISFFNNDNELVLLPVSRLLSIEIFPSKEWR